MFKYTILTEKRLFNHINKCKNNETLIEKELPKERKNIFYFKNNNNKFIIPFYLAADF